MPEEQITLEQVVKEIRTLQKSLDTLSNTVHSDIKDMSDVRNKVKINNKLITDTQQLISQEGRMNRNTVERTLDLHLRPLRYVQTTLSSFLANKPKSIYFIKGTTFWDFILRRNKYHDEVIKGVSV